MTQASGPEVECGGAVREALLRELQEPGAGREGLPCVTSPRQSGRSMLMAAAGHDSGWQSLRCGSAACRGMRHFRGTLRSERAMHGEKCMGGAARGTQVADPRLTLIIPLINFN
jgi:hypothetical protein